MKKLNTLIAALLIGTIISCSDDEEKKSPMELSTGSYTYTASMVLISDRNQTDSESGTLDVYYDDGDVEFYFDEGTSGEVHFELRNVTEASNGYVFDIIPETHTDSDGDTFRVIGFDGYSLDNDDFHGSFDTGSNQMFVNFYTDYDNSAYDEYNIEFKVVANKK